MAGKGKVIAPLVCSRAIYVTLPAISKFALPLALPQGTDVGLL